jgi:hypothetical protein
MSDDIIPLKPETAPQQFPVFYSKSQFHRVIHADGVYGGATPTAGNIIVHIFSHRLPIPEHSANDAKGDEIIAQRAIKAGIEREVEVSCVMNLALAKSMRDWLDGRIKHVEETMKKAGIK